jgi:acetolactate synthase-1/2/3 large subunit
MKNVDLIVRTLEDAGVRWVFGVPSGPVLPLIEALAKSQKVQYVLTASETSAGFMASTVGALTGVPGVCVSTLGPGATNLATGVGAAWLDRAPVIAITCNVDTAWLDRRIQMRIDHHAFFQPLTKASLPLRHANVASRLAEAFALAVAEPPGPVHLDLPEDVGMAEAVATPVPPAPTPQLPLIAEEAIEQAAEALTGSRRPLLVTGLTATRTRLAASLLSFVEKQSLPFVTTLHAKGFLPESHPNYAGVIGRARRSDVQAFVSQADLILAIGYDPVEINYEEWTGDTPIVHLSTEQADGDGRLRFVVNAAGDLNNAVDALARLPATPNDWQLEDIAAHRDRLEAQLRPAGFGFGAPEVLDVLRQRLDGSAILAYDVGAHTHQVATQWRTDAPNTCISTNGWSSMGYGIPAAYAAKLVFPERAVVGVVGDGCFQMTVGELAVGRRLGLRVPIVVLNDGWLSLIKVKQERKGYELSGVKLGERVAAPEHYFGVPARAANDIGQFEAALAWAFSCDGPSIIEAFIDAAPYSHTVYD